MGQAPADAVQVRPARREDLPRIVEMLADDALGARRERFETPLPQSYVAAFEAVAARPDNELVVACLEGEVVGVLQLTFIPYLTYQGSWRALVEGVRTAGSVRGRGIGGVLIEWAIARSRERGCGMVQLTTDKSRPDAKRFYEKLGFVASHEGMKLHLRD